MAEKERIHKKYDKNKKNPEANTSLSPIPKFQARPQPKAVLKKEILDELKHKSTIIKPEIPEANTTLNSNPNMPAPVQTKTNQKQTTKIIPKPQTIPQKMAAINPSPNPLLNQKKNQATNPIQNPIQNKINANTSRITNTNTNTNINPSITKAPANIKDVIEAAMKRAESYQNNIKKESFAKKETIQKSYLGENIGIKKR